MCSFTRCVILFVILASLICGSRDALGKELRGKPIVPRTKTAVKPPIENKISNDSTDRVPTQIGDYTTVSFDKLAGFTFESVEDLQSTNETKISGRIPDDVKAYDQKKVALKGFMLPLKVDDGVVTEMLIMKDQSMCCYGAVPRINDWVSVKMKNGGVKSVMDSPVTLFGKLKVGEMLENGYLIGIYEMEGDKMVESEQ